jgi:hypothetical protein
LRRTAVAKSKLEAHAFAIEARTEEGTDRDDLIAAALACLTIELQAEPSEAEIKRVAEELAMIEDVPTQEWRQYEHRAWGLLKVARFARLRELQDSNKEGGA